MLYDFNNPEDIPANIHHTFDCVVIDPPFITEEVWTLYAAATKLLLAPEGQQHLLKLFIHAPACRIACRASTSSQCIHLHHLPSKHKLWNALRRPSTNLGCMTVLGPCRHKPTSTFKPFANIILLLYKYCSTWAHRSYMSSGHREYLQLTTNAMHLRHMSMQDHPIPADLVKVCCWKCRPHSAQHHP